MSEAMKAHELHAQRWGVDPDELLAFYRGLGPNPMKLNKMAEMIESIAEAQKEGDEDEPEASESS